MSFREKVYQILDEDSKDTFAARFCNIFIISLIVLNVAAIILESFESIKINYQASLQAFEWFSIVVFTLEYILRLITADLKSPNKSKVAASIAFIVSPLAILDLLAILPAYLPLFFAVDLRFVRILRLLRIARLFKIKRYSKSLTLISDVIKEKRTELGATLFVTFILLVLASTLMYHVEGKHQPEAFPNIIASFWWAVATLTTVGYGDVYPVTGWGQFISGIIALLGIGLVALPTGILSSAFMDKIAEKNERTKGNACPTCGQSVEPKKELA